jgi:DNA-directed RNA polymerase specialized sigma subunit
MTCDDLKRLLTMHRQLESLDERILRLRAAMEPGAQHLSKMPHGTAERDKMAAFMAKLDELESQRVYDVVALEERAERACKAITILPEQQQTIIRLRYIEGLCWRDVSRQTRYCRRQCTYIHANAMERLNST